MASKQVKVILRHNSGIKGAEGLPGDVVEVSEKQAAGWFATKGAVPYAQTEKATNDKAGRAERR